MASTGRWQDNLFETSAEQFDAAQSASFERRSRSRMHRIADSIALHNVVADNTDIGSVMQAALNGSDDLNGLRFVESEGHSITVGVVDSIPVDSSSAHDDNNLYMSYTVRGPDADYGTLYGSFAMGAVQAETADFREFLVAQDSNHQTSQFCSHPGHCPARGCNLWRRNLVRCARPVTPYPGTQDAGEEAGAFQFRRTARGYAQ